MSAESETQQAADPLSSFPSGVAWKTEEFGALFLSNGATYKLPKAAFHFEENVYVEPLQKKTAPFSGGEQYAVVESQEDEATRKHQEHEMESKKLNRHIPLCLPDKEGNPLIFFCQAVPPSQQREPNQREFKRSLPKDLTSSMEDLRRRADKITEVRLPKYQKKRYEANTDPEQKKADENIERLMKERDAIVLKIDLYDERQQDLKKADLTALSKVIKEKPKKSRVIKEKATKRKSTNEDILREMQEFRTEMREEMKQMLKRIRSASTEDVEPDVEPDASPSLTEAAES